jgi:hypothetical protein
VVQRLSCCRSYSAAHKKRTDGQTLPTRCEEREDDHEEFVEYETDPYSSCKIEPEPSQLEVCPWMVLCHSIPQIHAYLPTASSPRSREEGRRKRVLLKRV